MTPSREYDCRYKEPLPRHDGLISLAEMVARIEAIRAAEPEFHCGACGSQTPLSVLIERRRIA